MVTSGLCRVTCAAIVVMCVGACSGERSAEAPETTLEASPADAPAPAAPSKADSACPLTVEQVTAITGAPMTLTEGGCTFFPANGRDIPHVFYVLQNTMVCTSIKPGDLGFTETVAGLPAREAYTRDAIDGAHLLVCPNGGSRAFDIVVNIRNDKLTNREAAIALTRQVLAAR